MWTRTWALEWDIRLPALPFNSLTALKKKVSVWLSFHSVKSWNLSRKVYVWVKWNSTCNVLFSSHYFLSCGTSAFLSGGGFMCGGTWNTFGKIGWYHNIWGPESWTEEFRHNGGLQGFCSLVSVEWFCGKWCCSKISYFNIKPDVFKVGAGSLGKRLIE